MMNSVQTKIQQVEPATALEQVNQDASQKVNSPKRSADKQQLSIDYQSSSSNDTQSNRQAEHSILSERNEEVETKEQSLDRYQDQYKRPRSRSVDKERAYYSDQRPFVRSSGRGQLNYMRQHISGRGEYRSYYGKQYDYGRHRPAYDRRPGETYPADRYYYQGYKGRGRSPYYYEATRNRSNTPRRYEQPAGSETVSTSNEENHRNNDNDSNTSISNSEPSSSSRSSRERRRRYSAKNQDFRKYNYDNRKSYGHMMISDPRGPKHVPASFAPPYRGRHAASYYEDHEGYKSLNKDKVKKKHKKHKSSKSHKGKSKKSKKARRAAKRKRRSKQDKSSESDSYVEASDSDSETKSTPSKSLGSKKSMQNNQLSQQKNLNPQIALQKKSQSELLQKSPQKTTTTVSKDRSKKQKTESALKQYELVNGDKNQQMQLQGQMAFDQQRSQNSREYGVNEIKFNDSSESNQKNSNLTSKLISNHSQINNSNTQFAQNSKSNSPSNIRYGFNAEKQALVRYNDNIEGGIEEEIPLNNVGGNIVQVLELLSQNKQKSEIVQSSQKEAKTISALDIQAKGDQKEFSQVQRQQNSLPQDQSKATNGVQIREKGNEEQKAIQTNQLQNISEAVKNINSTDLKQSLQDLDQNGNDLQIQDVPKDIQEQITNQSRAQKLVDCNQLQQNILDINNADDIQIKNVDIAYQQQDDNKMDIDYIETSNTQQVQDNIAYVPNNLVNTQQENGNLYIHLSESQDYINQDPKKKPTLDIKRQQIQWLNAEVKQDDRNNFSEIQNQFSVNAQNTQQIQNCPDSQPDSFHKQVLQQQINFEPQKQNQVTSQQPQHVEQQDLNAQDKSVYQNNADVQFQTQGTKNQNTAQDIINQEPLNEIYDDVDDFENQANALAHEANQLICQKSFIQNALLLNKVSETITQPNTTNGSDVQNNEIQQIGNDVQQDGYKLENDLQINTQKNQDIKQNINEIPNSVNNNHQDTQNTLQRSITTGKAVPISNDSAPKQINNHILIENGSSSQPQQLNTSKPVITLPAPKIQLTHSLDDDECIPGFEDGLPNLDSVSLPSFNLNMNELKVKPGDEEQIVQTQKQNESTQNVANGNINSNQATTEPKIESNEQPKELTPEEKAKQMELELLKGISEDVPGFERDEPLQQNVQHIAALMQQAQARNKEQEEAKVKAAEEQLKNTVAYLHQNTNSSQQETFYQQIADGRLSHYIDPTQYAHVDPNYAAYYYQHYQQPYQASYDPYYSQYYAGYDPNQVHLQNQYSTSASEYAYYGYYPQVQTDATQANTTQADQTQGDTTNTETQPQDQQDAASQAQASAYYAAAASQPISYTYPYSSYSYPATGYAYQTIPLASQGQAYQAQYAQALPYATATQPIAVINPQQVQTAAKTETQKAQTIQLIPRGSQTPITIQR